MTAVDTSMRLVFELARMQSGGMTTILPRALLVMAKLGRPGQVQAFLYA